MFKFEITCPNTFLLFTNSLYVETSLEFNVTSVVVIVFVCVPLEPEPANSNDVEALYLGVVNPTVYITPIAININTTNIICAFLFQNIMSVLISNLYCINLSYIVFL